MATVNVYNYTRRALLIEDATSLATWIQVDLYSTFVFNAAATDIGMAQVGSVKIPYTNGIPPFTKINNRVFNSLNTNEAVLNGDGVVYVATAPTSAAHALLSLGGYTPLAHIDFGGLISLPVNQLWGISFNSDALFTWRAT